MKINADLHYRDDRVPANDNIAPFKKTTEYLMDEVADFEAAYVLRKRRRTAAEVSRLSEMLGTLTVNLGQAVNDNRRLAIPRDDHPRYPMPCGRSMLCGLIDVLLELGYIEQELGSKFRQRITALTPTDQFKELLDTFGVIPLDFRVEYKPDRSDTVVLKSKRKDYWCRGKSLLVPDTPQTRQIRDEVVLINNHFESMDIDMASSVRVVNGVDLGNRYVRRFFCCGDFQFGGRYFGGSIMNMKKSERKGLLFNGEQTVELDFSNFNLHTAYCLAGVEPPVGDLYKLDGYPRDGIKKVCCAMFHSTSDRTQFPKGTRCFFSDPKVSFTDVWSDFLKKHQAIAHLFDAVEGEHEIGYRLQNMESEVITRVLLRCVEAEIPVYPIHDCVITTKSHKDEVRSIMVSEYKGLMGYEIEVELK
ncbi:hypothetical protein [Terasakiella pusilla]|uniref:hypothetical protein n=1 Tax=Terasakiella pusilla TaxID=64973 RepID=UPI003AA94FE5